MAKYTEDGRFEIPDPTPIELPIDCQKPESLESMIARMVRAESLAAGRDGLETFEEADDFDIEEDELVSEYELKEMKDEHLVQVRPTDKREPDPAPDKKDEEKQEVKSSRKTKKIPPETSEVKEEHSTPT